MQEELDNHIVLTWQKTALCRRAIPLTVRSNLHKPFTENVIPVSVLRHPDDFLVSIGAQVWRRCDARPGESRYLVTCQWRGESHWSHAASVLTAKRIAARWLDKWATFNDNFRISEP